MNLLEAARSAYASGDLDRAEDYLGQHRDAQRAAQMPLPERVLRRPSSEDDRWLRRENLREALSVPYDHELVEWLNAPTVRRHPNGGARWN